MPRCKESDWLNSKQIGVELTNEESANRITLESLVETDMELKLDYDLLLLAAHEPVSNHLKVMSKKIWMQAASVPNCRPVNTKISIIPQNLNNKLQQESFTLRIPKLFDFGLRIPDGGYGDLTDHILVEKKIHYGNILKQNDDLKKLETELVAADPKRVFDPSNYTTPTIASVFAEHEVLGYLQLRFIKIREYRVKILRQLNFFRSIERRVVLELINIENIRANTSDNKVAKVAAEMIAKQEYFDLIEKLSSHENFMTDIPTEDLRTLDNGRIYVTDRKGTNIIYDCSIKDLEIFDDEMIRILTYYINSQNQEDSPNTEYLDELRFRAASKRRN